jgi:hypothetical protein
MCDALRYRNFVDGEHASAPDYTRVKHVMHAL